MIPDPAPHATAAAVEVRPRLRGWSHVVATVPWAVATVFLVVLAGGHPGRQAALLLYGAASVVLFGVSGAYHVGGWSPRRRRLLRRLDHGNIFILVASTYTPVAVTVLDGAWRISILAVVWGLAAAGYVLEVATLALPRWALALSYVLLGWVAVVAMPVIASAVGGGGLALLLLAGGLYSAGALAYALRRPTIVRGWFGYHEVFHALVIAANALFLVFMTTEVARRA